MDWGTCWVGRKATFSPGSRLERPRRRIGALAGLDWIWGRPKKWPLAYQPEERKRRSVSDLVGKLYELDRLEFSFPPAGVFQIKKAVKIKTKTREEKLSFPGTYNGHNWGAIWSYRALVKAILNRIWRSCIQGGSRGPQGSRTARKVVFS